MTAAITPETLAAQGVEKVKATGVKASLVAADIVGAEWEAMPDEAKLHLCILGLADLISDGMAEERARAREQEEEEFRRQDEAERQKRIAEEKERRRQWEEAQEKRYREGMQKFQEKDRQERKWWSNLRESKEQQEEISRLHALAGCTLCGNLYAQVHCLGGREALDRLPQEREAVARDKGVYREKVRRIHAEMKCREDLCNTYVNYMEKCVEEHILSLPEDQQQAQIDKLRSINEQAEADSLFFRIGAERGYRLAAANLKSIMLITSDGKMKSLLDFTLDDVKGWRAKSKANAVSWKKRRQFFEKVEAMLTEANAGTVYDLPRESIEQLASEAEAIWKKKRKGRTDEAEETEAVTT